jgi:DmsE family decaheme c-type cytochrome
MKRSTIFTVATVLALASMAAAQEPVTMETCAICHEDVAPVFAAGTHGRAMARVDSAILDGSCVGCHSPAAEHVDDPTTDNIKRFPDAGACLACHPGQQGLTDISTASHVRSGVACLDCHGSGHDELNTDHMLQSAPHKLCAECHLSESGSFQMPYAHRDGTRPFECTNCHSVHGDNRQGRLAMIGSGGVCLDCHTEKTGPFVYPHPPQQLNGCINCYVPHGSPNPKLLTRHRVAALCIECHSNVPAFHDISRPRYQSCQNCHAAVHGSNRDPLLFEE